MPFEAEADASLAHAMRQDLAKEEANDKATTYFGEGGRDVPSITPPPASSNELERALLGEASSSHVGIQTVFCQLLVLFCFDSQALPTPKHFKSFYDYIV